MLCKWILMKKLIVLNILAAFAASLAVIGVNEKDRRYSNASTLDYSSVYDASSSNDRDSSYSYSLENGNRC